MTDEIAGGVDPNQWSPRVVIVGGGVSGYAAARRLHEDLPRARIHLYDANDWHHYSSCGMTFAIEGMYPIERVLLHTPEEYDTMGIEVHEKVMVTDVDLDGRAVQLSSGEVARFDVLVLATGRKAFKPPIPGIDLPGVHTLSNYGDGVALNDAVDSATNAVVVGGGAIGLETAIALKSRGLDVTVVEMLPHLLPQMLDMDMGLVVRDHLEAKGIRVLTGVPVGRIVPGEDGRVSGVDLLGETVPTDLVVISAGVRPEVSLAETTGIELGRTGGYATDAHMRAIKDGTALEGVYAIGDCAEVDHAVLGRETLSPLASTALYEARTISRHLVDPSYVHRPMVAPAVVVIGDLEVGGVGITEHGGEHAGIGTWGLHAMGADRSRYFPGVEDIHLRLVGDQEGNIVGAQAIGKRDVKERMNMMALVILEQIPAERLVYVERAYSPPVQLLADPLLDLLEQFIEVKVSMTEGL